MKKKMMNRAAAFAASVLMTAALAVSASAAEPVDTQISGKTPAFCAVTQIDIPKKIYLFNPDNKAVYAPNITYTYTLGLGEGGDKITGLTWDAATNAVATPESKTSVTVKKGIQDAIKISGNTETTDGTAKLEFGKTNDKFATEKAETKGTANFEELKLHVEKGSVDFPGAGVYRYTLTEDADKEAAGVTDTGEAEDAEVKTRYLDVYVNAEGAIYGYVLADKADGYVYDEEATEAGKKVDKLDPDFYATQNYKITKHITGSMADKNHEFPVEIKLADSIASAEIYGTADGTDFGGTAVNDVTVGSYGTKNYTLKDGEYVEIIGIPVNATVTVDETNDTADNYNATLVETKPSGNKKVEGQEIEAGKKLSEALGSTTNLVFTLAQNENSYEADLTNNLETVSPTGLFFRMVPFALMMTAGGALIAVYLRGRKRDDAESMI